MKPTPIEINDPEIGEIFYKISNKISPIKHLFISKEKIFVILNTSKNGRNDPCFCGSGKKFKKCCKGIICD